MQLVALVSLIAVGTTRAFIAQPNVGFGCRTAASSSALWQHRSSQDNENTDPSSFVNRRDVISKSAAAAMATAVASFANIGTFRSFALADEGTDIGTSPEHPIVIIGAGGKVCQLLSTNK